MIINLGDAPFKAFIKVTYPSGTCTVSLGDKSFTHSGGGTHTFIVNKKGTWTVTMQTLAGETKTATADVTTRGQTVNVAPSFLLYLFHNGNQYTSVSGGWQASGNASVSGSTLNFRCDNNGTSESVGYCQNGKDINLSGYKRVYFDINIATNRQFAYISIMSGSTTVATKTKLGPGTHYLDIPSNLSNARIRVGMGNRMLGSINFQGTCSSVRLSTS